jgi:hypothetical protein
MPPCVRKCPPTHARATERRARLFEDELVENLLLLVHCAVDAVHLVARDHVGREFALDFAEATIVDILEGFKGPHEVVEYATDSIRRRLDFRFAAVGSEICCLLSHEIILV